MTTKYRFGLDEDQVKDVKELALAIAAGEASVQSASVHREGSNGGYLTTTLTVTLVERSRSAPKSEGDAAP